MYAKIMTILTLNHSIISSGFEFPYISNPYPSTFHFKKALLQAILAIEIWLILWLFVQAKSGYFWRNLDPILAI